MRTPGESGPVRTDLSTATIAGLPKSDIHMHAETGARVDRLMASRQGKDPYDWRGLVQSLKRMPAGMTRLQALGGGIEVMDLDRVARENFVEWVADAMQGAAQDGTILLEIRFGSGWATWPDLMSRFREAELLTQTEHPGFCAEAIISGISPGRPEGNDVFDVCLDASSDGLAGIDFFPLPYERETEGDQWDAIYSWAERAVAAGLGITVHAGEFSPANIRRALGVPGVTRIGHAVHSVNDPLLLDDLLEAEVTVECCLTSNVILGAVPSLEDHPIRTFSSVGIPVTLGSDDPIALDTSIGAEYQLAGSLEFSASELLGFTRNGIKASFASEERKIALLSQVTEYEQRLD